MKRSLTFKSLLITASLLSLFAFAFVNLRPNSMVDFRTQCFRFRQGLGNRTAVSGQGKLILTNIIIG